MFARIMAVVLTVILLLTGVLSAIGWVTLRDQQTQGVMEKLRTEAREIAYLAAQRQSSGGLGIFFRQDSPQQEYIQWKSNEVYDEYGAYILVVDRNGRMMDNMNVTYANNPDFAKTLDRQDILEGLSRVLAGKEIELHVNVDGNDFFYTVADGYWRMSASVDGVAYDAPERKGMLFEAARAFGQFQRRLADYPADTLHETIPNFHHTPTRYAAFEAALARDAAGRAESMGAEIRALKRLAPYASIITEKLEDGTIPLRVTHNDTKLNNVLFDARTDKATCVIDLDTVMPGSLLYDFGDALRFAGNRTAEDDPDLSRVVFDLDRYEEYVSGFLAGVGEAITEVEREMLPVSVLVITYEQALRFMTDYLDGDVYYQLRYPAHNYDRTRAQIRLCEDILSKLDEMREVTKRQGT